MKQIKEICRLYSNHTIGIRGIARACNISPSTAQAYIKKMGQLKLDFATIEAMGEDELHRLFNGRKAEHQKKPTPDLPYL